MLLFNIFHLNLQDPRFQAFFFQFKTDYFEWWRPAHLILINPKLHLSISFNLKRNICIVCTFSIVCGALIITYDWYFDNHNKVVHVRAFD